MIHVPCPGSREWGCMDLLYKFTIPFRLLGCSTTGNYTNFEDMDFEDMNTEEMTVCLAVVYRPPLSKENGSTIPDFLDQWSIFLAGYTTHNNEILISWYLNCHVDVENDRDAERFMDTIKACGLQHEREPTHLFWHALDVVISRHTRHIISDVTIIDPGLRPPWETHTWPLHYRLHHNADQTCSHADNYFL